MSKYVAIAITLMLLMALPILSLPYANAKVASLSAPVHNGYPMLPAPPTPLTPPGPAVPFPGLKASRNVCPNHNNTECTGSFNWGGYAVNATPNLLLHGVSQVNGSWTVPSLTGVNTAGGNGTTGSPCGGDASWYDVAVWIGIDGFSTGTVEQTGTASDCYYGTTFYYAWFEFYPAPSITVFNVNPGDKISAGVHYDSTHNRFTTVITDVTLKLTNSSKPTHVNKAEEGSAEWIIESAAACLNPSCSFLTLLDLSDFTPVTFTGATASIGTFVNAPISSFGENVFNILMINLNYPFTPGIKATTGALAKSGNKFTSDWVGAGP